MTRTPSVVFVVIDTVRRDRVSWHGYDRETTPNFDAFADDATVFTDAVSQAPWSVPSHASLFTGQYPFEHGTTSVRPIFREKRPLATRLSAAGYETYAVSPNEYVRPLTGFGRGFDEFDTLSGFTVPNRVAEVTHPIVHSLTASRARIPLERLFNVMRRRESAVTGTEGHAENGLVDTVDSVLAGADDPFFLFVNLFDCHLPRTPARKYVDQFVDEDLHGLTVAANERAHMLGDRRLSDRKWRKMSQLYDADLRTTDERLGELVALLEDFEGLVVLVSDHGEHLGEFDLIGHQFSVFEPTVSVPMAIQFPDGGPDTVDEQVETRRVFHTILDETGVESYPEQSLTSWEGDDVAYGEFASPMVDIDSYLWQREFRYDGSLVGEPLKFARTGEQKLVSFDGDGWVFELPEWERSTVPWEEGLETYRSLGGFTPQPTAAPPADD